MDPTLAQLADLAAGASATGGDASERAKDHSGEPPLAATYLFPQVSQWPRSGWVLFMTGSVFDLVLALGAALKSLVRRLRRRPVPTQIAALYDDRIEVLTWPPGPTSSPEVVTYQIGGKLIYVGTFTVRIHGTAWGISLEDREALVNAMLGSAWRPQLVRIG